MTVHQCLVEVPATSANLGPGFDALAVALDIKLEVRSQPRATPRVQTEGEGAEELPTDERNLVWRALVAYCAWAGVDVPDVGLRVRNPLPLERGVGSSAAAAVAGVVLGRALTGGRGGEQDLIGLAAELEGHADNAAAAVLGGLVVCAGGRAWRFDPDEQIEPVVCIPENRQATDAARGLLPAHVPLADAAANGARAALVVAGLSGSAPFDPAVMLDVLHEPARLAAMPASGALVQRLRAAGVAACLSGAGPSVLALVPAGGREPLETIDAAAGDGWQVRATRWNRAGAVVTRLDGAGR